MRSRVFVATVGVLIGLAGALFLPAPTRGRAEAAPAARPATRMAIVRIVDLMNGYQQARDLADIFGERRLEFEAENQQRQEALARRSRELANFRRGTAEYRAREADLLRQSTEYEVHARLTALHLERGYRDGVERAYQQACQSAGELARSQGIQAVFSLHAPVFDAADANVLMQQAVLREVIYADAAIDLTDQVIARINDAYAKQGGRKALQASLGPLAGP